MDLRFTKERKALKTLIKFEKTKKETEMTTIIKPFLDSGEITIEAKDINHFKKKFRLLTNTCNRYHKTNNHEFIEIKIPDFKSISNQIFKK